MLQQAIVRDPTIDTNNAQRLFTAMRGTAAGENPAMVRLHGNMLKHAARGAQVNFKSFLHYGLQLMSKKLYGPESNLYKSCLHLHAKEPGIAGATIDQLINGKSEVKWDLGLIMTVVHSLFEDQRRFFRSKPSSSKENWSDIITMLDDDERSLWQQLSQYAVLLDPEVLVSWLETIWVNSGYAIQKRVSQLFNDEIQRTLSQSGNIIRTKGNVTGYCVPWCLGGKCVGFKCKQKHKCFECEEPHRFINCPRYPKVKKEDSKTSTRSGNRSSTNYSGYRPRSDHHRGKGNDRVDGFDKDHLPGNFDNYNKRNKR